MSFEPPFKPLVVGAPRSGFTLLLTVLYHLAGMRRLDAPLTGVLLREAIDLFGDHVSNEVTRVVTEAGRAEDLVYSPNFRKMVGGPKWLHKEDPTRACFRKYVGVRGLGDFTLITSHPREVLEYDIAVHCHVDPVRWLSEPYYRPFQKFATVRSPIGVINSSLLSINALTSEYIQRFVPPQQDNHAMREHLALFKFTSLDFYRGLVKFYRDWYAEFMPVRSDYTVMRWEDLITDPVATIQYLAEECGLEYVDAGHAAQIWQAMDHANLTGAHQHNFRPGGGKVGDWRNWMTNRHLDILRDEGMETVMEDLGYGPMPVLDESRYTPFQRRVEEMMAAGEVYDDYPDRELFGFAFNKSNIDSSKFPFKRYGWREATQVERADFRDEALMMACWDAAEAATLRLNKMIRAILDNPPGETHEVDDWIDNLAHAVGDLAERMPKAFEAAGERLGKAARRWFAARDAGLPLPHGRAPRLIRPLGPYGLACDNNRFYGIPLSAGTVDLSAPQSIPHLVTRDSYADLVESLMGAAQTYIQTGRFEPVGGP